MTWSRFFDAYELKAHHQSPCGIEEFLRSSAIAHISQALLSIG
jgi:hypothetical protein